MRRASTALTPVLISFLSITAFLAVMWFAMQGSEQVSNTNTSNTNSIAANANVSTVNDDRTLVTNSSADTNQTICRPDIEICPDGSVVRREGLSCEFSICPETDRKFLFNPNTSKVGDVVAGLTITSIGKFNSDPQYADATPNWKIRFAGQISLTASVDSLYGEYKGIDPLCIQEVKSIDASKFPRISEQKGQLWFCFTNQEEGLRAFPTKSDQEFAITIDEFTIQLYPSEVYNTAKFISKSEL